MFLVPFYIIQTEKFNFSIPFYTSNLQQEIAIPDTDLAPSSSYTLDTNINIDGFKAYKLQTETKLNFSGRAYGREDPFYSLIKIVNDVMFYNINHKILILSTSKESFTTFIKDFNIPDHSEYISLIKNEIDFEKIISSGYSHGVQRVWFGKINDTQLKHEALYGNRLEASERYKELLKDNAKITNLTINILYKNISINVMITKDSGIILDTVKSFKSENEKLDFIMFIYENI